MIDAVIVLMMDSHSGIETPEWLIVLMVVVVIATLIHEIFRK